jgi:hypothetical protein
MNKQTIDVSIQNDPIQDNIKTEKVTTNQVLISLGENVRTKEVQNREIDWDEFINNFILQPKEHVIKYDNHKRDEKTFKLICDNNKIVELDHAEAIKQLISIEKKTNLPYFVGGHFEPAQRNNKNLQFRSLLVLDIDKYPEGIEQLELKLEQELKDFEYVAYSTPSHTSQVSCIRVLIRCNNYIEPKDYNRIVNNFSQTLSFQDYIDQASRTPSQGMLLPVVITIKNQPDSEVKYQYEFWSKRNVGNLFDWKFYINKEEEIDTTRQKSTDKKESRNRTKIDKRIFSVEKVNRLLELYPVSNLNYQEWLEVGMAIHHYYEGSEHGLAVWDHWSSTDENKDRYNPEVVASTYYSFQLEVENPVTMLTIQQRVYTNKVNNFNKSEKIKLQKNIGGYDFVLTDDTLYFITEKKDDCGIKQEVPVRVSDYIELKGQGQNSEGQYCFIMSIIDRQRIKKDIFIPLVAKNDVLKQHLLDAGLNFNPMHFFALTIYILVNKTDTNVSIIYRLGWNTDLSCYNLPTKEGLQTFYRDRVETRQLNVLEFKMKQNELLQQKGTLKEWQDNIPRLAKNNSNLCCALYTAFTPIFFTPLNREGVILHFFGESSKGKSVMLGVAGSVWGNYGKGYIPWNGTANGIENLALQKNDSLLCLDELTNLKTREVIEQVAYLIINGQSKNRADSKGVGFGNRTTKTWNTMVLSSGEPSFAAHIANLGGEIKGGQTVRFIDIPAVISAEWGVFEDLHDKENPKQFAEFLRDACFQYKGTPINAFLAYIFIENNFDDILKEIELLKTEWLDLNLPANATSQVGRVAEVLSIIAAAGVIATKSGVLPEKYGFTKAGVFEDAVKIFRRWLNEIEDYTIPSEVKAIKQRLIKFWLDNHNNFYCNGQEESLRPPIQHKCVGIMSKKPEDRDHRFSIIDQPVFYVFQNVLESEALKGLNLNYCKKIMREKSYIIPYEEKYGDNQITYRSAWMVHYAKTNNKMRCYRLNLEALGIIESIQDAPAQIIPMVVPANYEEEERTAIQAENLN